MTLPDLAQLARAATPGPWRVEHVAGYCIDYVLTEHPEFQDKPHGNYVSETTYAAGHKEQRFSADSAFIAAANPTAVLALIEVAEAAKEWRNTIGCGWFYHREKRLKFDAALIKLEEVLK